MADTRRFFNLQLTADSFQFSGGGRVVLCFAAFTPDAGQDSVIQRKRACDNVSEFWMP